MLPLSIAKLIFEWSPNFTSGRGGKQIKRIIIHDTEGGSTEAQFHGSAEWLASTQSHVSAHYVLNEAGDEIIQEVNDLDTAWHCGNWVWNQESIGIEHAGRISEDFYSDSMYRTSAKVVAYLCMTYFILPTREYILGHFEVPDQLAPAHTDPGSPWDWEKYMGMVREEYATLLGKTSGPTPDPNVWVCQETGKEVNNVYNFLTFWKTKGGIETYGLPITGAYGVPASEKNPEMVVQYFERSRFEYHLNDKKIYLGNIGTELVALLNK